MAYSMADIAKFGPAAQKQIYDKVTGTAARRNKMGNVPAAVNGIRFDS